MMNDLNQKAVLNSFAKSFTSTISTATKSASGKKKVKMTAQQISG